MLRAILSAIGNGIRNAFGYAWSIFTWPFRLFMPRQRQSLAPTLQAMKEQLQKPAEKPSDVVQSRFREDHVKDSVIAWSFVNGCIIDGKTRPMPSTLSHKMRDWLQGLTFTQLLKLKSAGPQGVLEHASAKNVIAGVPLVSKLPAIEVRYPAEVLVPYDEETPTMASILA
jgi:hypothetical protein